MTDDIQHASLPAGDYAIVELMGHVTLVGRVSEVERFGVKMLAVQPMFNGKLLSTVFYSAAAIYGVTPCSLEIAWAKQPTRSFHLPPSVLAILPLATLGSDEHQAHDVTSEQDEDPEDDEDDAPF